jgi:hypothetical protein
MPKIRSETRAEPGTVKFRESTSGGGSRSWSGSRIRGGGGSRLNAEPRSGAVSLTMSGKNQRRVKVMTRVKKI